VDNPALALAQLLAQLRDKNGRITIPGFTTMSFRFRLTSGNSWRVCHDTAPSQSFWAFPVFGERGYTATEQRTARPTLKSMA
jgi:hypothetical protein